MGVVVVLDAAADPAGYWGEVSLGTCAIDIWIADAAQLRKGYGTVMMENAIDRCFHVHSAHTILIDPLAENEGAISFYPGNRPCGEHGPTDCHLPATPLSEPHRFHP